MDRQVRLDYEELNLLWKQWFRHNSPQALLIRRIVKHVNKLMNQTVELQDENRHLRQRLEWWEKRHGNPK